MLKGILSKKMIGLILKQKTFRVTLVLSATFLIIIIILNILNASYNKKITSNEKQIQDTIIQLEELEKIVNEDENEEAVNLEIENRAFASYQEIVPFINLLESLFAIIDKESKILVRDNKDQILINRYADYEVTLKPGIKMDLFLKALNELHKSKYITKVTKFTINYIPDKQEAKNKINDINLTIRLFFE